MVPLHGTYRMELVALSFVVAAVASLTALDLARHVAAAHGRARAAWLGAGAVAMGIGIWSMHFVAMLAYELPVSMSYDPTLVGLSVVVAIAASGVALAVASREHVGLRIIAASGLSMGPAIAGMHYVGMAALRVPARVQWDVATVAVSVVIAVSASCAALWLFVRFRGARGRQWPAKIASAVVMAIAISGMHYTGMSAARFVQVRGVADMPAVHGVPARSLGLFIGVATLLILGAALAGGFVDRRTRARLEAAEAQRRRDAQLRSFYESLSIGIVVQDTAGIVTHVNEVACTLLGIPSDRMTGCVASKMMGRAVSVDGTTWTPDAWPGATALRTGQPAHGAPIGVAAGTESERWLLLDAVPRRDPSSGALTDVVTSVVDVTERRRAEVALAASQAELRALVGAMSDVILVLDADGRYLRIAETNTPPAYRPPAELVGRSVHDVFPRDAAALFLRHIGRALETRETVDIEYCLPIEGRTVWFGGAISPLSEREVVWVAREISDRKRAEEALREESLTDELTGVYNRRGFLRAAARELADARRDPSRQLLLVLADVDDLKVINDTRGHAAGDAALATAAAALRDVVRGSDVVGRWGGDEFVVLISHGTAATLDAVRSRLTQRLAALTAPVGEAVPIAVSLSLGATFVAPAGDRQLEDALAEADAALYAVKRARRRLSA